MEEAAFVAQRIEVSRSTQARVCLERFVNLERQHLSGRLKALNAFAPLVKAVDTEGDLRRVVDHLKRQASVRGESRSRLFKAGGSSWSLSSAATAQSAAESADLAAMTQTRGYSRALALLDWDFKRQADRAAEEAEEAAKAAEAEKLAAEAESRRVKEAARLAETKAADSGVESDGSGGGGSGGGAAGAEFSGGFCDAGVVAPSQAAGPRSPLSRKGSVEPYDLTAMVDAVAAAKPAEAEAKAAAAEPDAGTLKSVGVEDLAKQLVFREAGVGPAGFFALQLSSCAAVGQELAHRCEARPARVALLRLLTERRTGEVEIANLGDGRFEAVCGLFRECLRWCDGSRDIKSAKQLMIMSESYYAMLPSPRGPGADADSADDAPGAREGAADAMRIREGSSGGGNGGNGSSGSEESSGSEGSSSGGAAAAALEKVYIAARIADHVLFTRKWFWEELMLSGVTEQFDLAAQLEPWEALEPSSLFDEVCRVHNTVFGQLGAIVSNMARFGRSEHEIRNFLTKMCARSQLVEDQVLQLTRITDSAIQEHADKQPKEPWKQIVAGGPGGESDSGSLGRGSESGGRGGGGGGDTPDGLEAVLARKVAAGKMTAAEAAAVLKSHRELVVENSRESVVLPRFEWSCTGAGTGSGGGASSDDALDELGIMRHEVDDEPRDPPAQRVVQRGADSPDEGHRETVYGDSAKVVFAALEVAAVVEKEARQTAAAEEKKEAQAKNAQAEADAAAKAVEDAAAAAVEEEEEARAKVQAETAAVKAAAEAVSAEEIAAREKSQAQVEAEAARAASESAEKAAFGAAKATAAASAGAPESLGERVSSELAAGSAHPPVQPASSAAPSVAKPAPLPPKPPTSIVGAQAGAVPSTLPPPPASVSSGASVGTGVGATAGQQASGAAPPSGVSQSDFDDL